MWRDSYFLVFACYWMLAGWINLTDFIPGIAEEHRIMIGVLYNMADIPLLLGILCTTTSSILVRRFTWYCLLLYIPLEILNAIVNGVNYDAIKYPLGSGLILILIVLCWEIIRYLQKIEHTNRQHARVCIYAGLLFQYGTFVVIYIFDYFIPTTNTQDNFLIYYISLLIAISIAAVGFIIAKPKKDNLNQYLVPIRDIKLSKRVID